MSHGLVKVQLHIVRKGGTDRCFNLELEDKDMEDKLVKLLGDEKAKMQVGMNFDSKDYGNGYGMFLSATVTCNQDTKTMKKAASLGAKLLKSCVPGIKEIAQSVFETEFGT